MTQPKPGTGGQRGAQPANTKSSKKPWWLLALLAIIVIVVLLLLLSRCGNDNNDAAGGVVAPVTSAGAAATSTASSATASETPTPTTATTAPQSTTAPVSTAPTPSAALTSEGKPLLPVATAATGGKYTALVDQTATADRVTVQSVPVDAGFWVGTSETDRVWVQLTGPGESPYKVTPGSKVSFTGTIVGNPPNFPATVGLTEAAGAAQLTSQGAHIALPKIGLTLFK